MTEFFLKARDGVVRPVKGREGVPLMEIIRAAGFHELSAMCGGCLSCATCHVYIEGASEKGTLPQQGCDEDALLDGSDCRRPDSRLSCQIPYSAALSGVIVTIAPEE